MNDSASHSNRYQRLAEQWTAAQPVVAGFIASMIRDRHAAEDVLQKTASALVAKYDEYDPSRPFASWAMGMARFEVLNHLRRSRRDPHQFAGATLDAVAAGYEQLHDELQDRKRALADCMDELPDRSVELLTLRYTDDRTPAQIADAMRTNANRVRVMLHRVRELLAECIRRRMEGERA